MLKPVFIFLSLLCPAFAVALTLPVSEPVPGGIAIVSLEGSESQAPQVKFNGRRTMVVKDGPTWKAVIGIPLVSSPGQYKLQVDWPSGRHDQPGISVSEKKYPVQYITGVDQGKVNLSAADLQRNARDQKIIGNTLSIFSSTEPDMDFLQPTEGPLSKSFGSRRFFNKQPRQPHKGLDISAHEGQPIHAPASGKVICVSDFFFTGNTVFIDHGLGLITLYAHMSETDVKTGEEVYKGQLLGKVGHTGRATGPHLHFSVFLNGTAVDPTLFLQEKP